MIKLPIRNIAQVCHEANIAFCKALGDESQPSWEDADNSIKGSAIQGVLYRINNPNHTPKDMHDNWMKFKIEDGWVYGPEKCPVNKTHPSLVPYEELSESERFKDSLFSAIVDQAVKHFKV